MNPLLDSALHRVRQTQRAALKQAQSRAIRGLDDLLRLDDERRHGHEPQKLESALGRFGSQSFNMDALARVLEKKPQSDALPPERRSRVERLLSQLKEDVRSLDSEPEAPPLRQWTGDPAPILDACEAHLNAQAERFGRLRSVQSELKSRPLPHGEDSSRARLSWSELTAAERSLCCPFVVCGEIGLMPGRTLWRAMELLHSGMPIRLVLWRKLQLDAPESSGSAIPALSPELAPFALRDLHLLQSAPGAPDFEDALATALQSPVPSLILLLSPGENESAEAYAERARRAAAAHCLPWMRYEPAAASGFVGRFTLFPAHAPAEIDGLPAFLTQSLAANLSSPQPADPASVPSPDLVPLEEFLELTPRQRMGRAAFVTHPSGDAGARKIVPSSLIAVIEERQQVQRTLEELTGVNNPFVRQAKRELLNEFEREQKQTEKEREQAFAAREAEIARKATAHAVQTLVTRFAGVPNESIPLDSLLGTGTNTDPAEPS